MLFCRNCVQILPIKARKGTKFCSAACRVAYWRKENWRADARPAVFDHKGKVK